MTPESKSFKGISPQSIKSMMTRFLKQYGVSVTWNIDNENGETETVSAVVLILKEKYNPLQPVQMAVGLSQDYTRYVLCLPNVLLEKGMVIKDAHGTRWKIGVVDWFDVRGVSVAKQAALLEVA